MLSILSKIKSIKPKNPNNNVKIAVKGRIKINNICLKQFSMNI